MLRKLLLPVFAAAALAGCATDYGYRNGNGDYYYGQPRVEYRQIGLGGYYGGYGLQYGYGGYGGYGYGPTYFYDRYGRLIYGYPGGYYGSPYYGGNGGYGPRPNYGHGNQHDNNNNGNNRPPPWRDLGGVPRRIEDLNGYPNEEARPRPMRRPQSESSGSMQIRPQSPSQSTPVIRESSAPSSRMGGFIRDASRPGGRRNTTPEE